MCFGRSLEVYFPLVTIYSLIGKQVYLTLNGCGLLTNQTRLITL